MSDVFPTAPIYTSVYEPRGTFPAFRNKDIRPSPLNRLTVLRRDHRRALPLLAPTFSAMTVAADVVIASSSGWAHGIKTNGRKIVYCYNPARWLYQADEYLGPRPTLMRPCLRLLAPALRRWDVRAAHSADRYFAISSVVQQRIATAYGIRAELLPPPHLVEPDGAARPVQGTAPGFFLVVSRLLPYKNVHCVVDSFSLLPDERLLVVGTGPMFGDIRRRAPGNVRMLGVVSDSELRWLYHNCAGLIAAGLEDFGLTPLEVNAFGKPAIILRAGGFLDTGVEHESCVFFDVPQPARVADAVRLARRLNWDRSLILANANRYSRGQFAASLREAIFGVTQVERRSAEDGGLSSP